MPSRKVIYDQNTNTFQVLGLADLDGAYLNSASITVTLKNTAGGTIAGQSFPLAVPYVSASNGDYEAKISSGLVVSPGDLLIAHLVITDTEGDGYLEVPCKVLTRTGL